MEWGAAIGLLSAAFGAALSAMAAGFGISKIASSSVESIARQPEAAGDIKFSMILTCALIEGVAFFAALICFLIQNNINLADLASAAHGGH